MQSSKTLITLIFLVLYTSGFSQSLEIFEHDQYNKNRTIKKLGIVDINSSLEININTDSIALALTNKNNHNGLQKTLTLYTDVLKSQSEIQTLLNTQFTSSTSVKEQREKTANYKKLVLELYEKIKANPALRIKFNNYQNVFYNQLSVAERKKWSDYYLGWGLIELNKEMVLKFDSIQQILKREQTTLQVYAFLHTKKESARRVHVENFDKFAVGEFYEVERFAKSLSDEDIKAFEYNQKLANQLNRLVKNNFKNVSELLKSSFSSYQCFDELFVDLKNAIDQKDELVSTKKAEIEQLIEATNRDVKAVTNGITQLKAQDANANQAINQFGKTQENLVSLTQNLIQNIQQLVNLLDQDLLNKNPQLNALKEKLTQCLAALQGDSEILNNIFNVTMNTIVPGAFSVETNNAISEEALKFGIDNLPERGFINLKTTGKREPFDKIEIQLRVTRPTIDSEPVIIENKILTMVQVKMHSIANVSLILADPFNQDTSRVKLTNRFQFAPSGNLLFKWGSRSSAAWNFINPGIGFTMNTPDFDLDGVPEVGVGALVTCLQDVLSFGISYNTKTDNPYWFFGLSLPFSTLGLPVNTIQVDKEN